MTKSLAFAALSSHRYGDDGPFTIITVVRFTVVKARRAGVGPEVGVGGIEADMELQGDLFLQMMVPSFPSLSLSVSSNSATVQFRSIRAARLVKCLRLFFFF